MIQFIRSIMQNNISVLPFLREMAQKNSASEKSINFLVQLMEHKIVVIRCLALQTVKSYVSGNDATKKRVVTTRALSILRTLCTDRIVNIQNLATETVSIIAGGDNNVIEKIIQSNIIPTMIMILNRYPTQAIGEIIKRTFANYVNRATLDQINYLIECGCVLRMPV
jgi:hypothetical protein